jgi:hypothetical protein
MTKLITDFSFGFIHPLINKERNIGGKVKY